VTRTASDVLADLASLASRQAALTAELAEALRATPIATPLPAAVAAPEYLTTREAAALLGVSVRTLATLRAEGWGPRHIRLGRAVRYLRDELGRAPQGSAARLALTATPGFSDRAGRRRSA
jgi:excisionase family DNA binding protein